jgi:Transposase DDE domain group 1
MVDLSAWPDDSRLIVRRERPHPGAQMSFTDHDGYRFQAILTDQADPDIAVLECRHRHRQHAHVEDRIREDKDTGLSKFPFKEFQLNEVWLEIVMLAHDLIVWTQALVLPRRARQGRAQAAALQAGHVARRLAFSGRHCKLHLQDTWPWAAELLATFRNSKRSTPPPADTAANPAAIQQSTQPQSPLPKTGQAHAPLPPATHHKQRLPARSPINKRLTHQNSHRSHPHTLTARPGPADC